MKGEFSLRRATRRWIYEHGYIVEPRRHVTALAMAERLRQIFADRAIERVIDVGGNEGQYGTFLRDRVGFTGEIISFEPIPAVAEKLRRKADADGNWSVRQFALGANSGRRTINVIVQSGYSSFHNVREEFAKVAPTAQRVDVEIQTLDGFFDKTDLSRTYLKLDTQGFDLEVLKGAQISIRQIPALQTEVSFQPIYHGMPTYQDALREFGQHGFLVADFFLAIADNSRAAIEFDCVMVRAHPVSRA